MPRSNSIGGRQIHAAEQGGPYPMKSYRSVLYAALIAIITGVPAPALTRAADQGSAVKAAGSYFVDFRARRGPSLGHIYIVYGRLSADGKIAEAEMVGFFPESQKPGAGVIVPTRSVVGTTKFDRIEPAVDSYRRHLTLGEFKKLKSMVSQVTRIEPSYHLAFFNCNDFVGEAAEAIGLRRPPSLMLPSSYVAWLRVLNGE